MYVYDIYNRAPWIYTEIIACLNVWKYQNFKAPSNTYTCILYIARYDAVGR